MGKEAIGLSDNTEREMETSKSVEKEAVVGRTVEKNHGEVTEERTIPKGNLTQHKVVYY